MKTFGTRAYSFKTCIKSVLPDGRTIGNMTDYLDADTRRHQRFAGCEHCDIIVRNVPAGTDDLTGWYLAQHPEIPQRVPGTFIDNEKEQR